MVKVDIEFFRPDQTLESFTLTWELIEKDYVFLWFRSLFQSLKKNEPAYGRFSGFSNSPKDMTFLSEKLNRTIEIINSDGLYHIKERATGEFNQEFANIIHHHFEILSGDAKNPSEIFRRSSPMGQGAIGDLNHLIHDMEVLDRVHKEQTSNRVIALEFLRRDQFWLTDEILKEFTFDIEFGDICLHYGLIGKSWWEVFLDKDEEIFDDAIRPLDVLGPEFDIQMVNFKTPETLEKISAFKDWLVRERKQDLNNPKLALGFLPLARLERSASLSDEDILKRVGERSGIKSIRLYDENKEWVKQDYTNCPTMNGGFFQVYPFQEVTEGQSLISQKVPFQTYLLGGAQEGSRLGHPLIKGEFFEGNHNISLVVPKDKKAVVVPVHKGAKGDIGDQDILVKPGGVLHLDYQNGTLYRSITPQHQK